MDKTQCIYFEEWRKITDDILPGVYDCYWVSNFGRLYSDNPAKRGGPSFLSPSMNREKGYLQIPLCTSNGRVTRKVHRLVMLAFNYIPDHMNFEVNHIDGCKTHNWLWNLEWSTSSEKILFMQ